MQGLVRHAGSRRERLLDDALPILSEGGEEVSTGSVKDSEAEVACASDLFAGVPSQSPFLTCRTQPTTVTKGTVLSAPVPPTVSSSDTSGPPAPPLPETFDLGPGLESLEQEPSSASGAITSNLAQMQPAHVHPHGLPAPRVPELPRLLDLREVLTEVQTQKAVGIVEQALSSKVSRRPLEGPKDGSSCADPSLDIPADNVFNVGRALTPTVRHSHPLEGAQDLTPRAGPSHPLSNDPLFDVADDAPLAFEFPDIDRPETPTPQSRSHVGEPASWLDSEPNPGTGDDNRDPGSVLGRTPASAKAIMDEAFQGIQKELSDVAARVGLPFHQVLNRFSLLFAHTCAMNYWNIYEKYHAANRDVEVARLGTGVNLTEVGPVKIMKACYRLFQEDPSIDWKQVLLKFDELSLVLNDSGKTMGHRQSLFFRLAENHCHAFMGMSKAHGFEVLMMIAGSVVHNDAPLGMIFTTPGAENFCQERCRTSDSDMLGHFKAHIYNKVSMENIALSHPSAPSAESSKQTTRPGGSSNARKEVDNNDEVEIVEVHEMDDHSRLRLTFIVALTKVGCRWASGKQFPWKGLPSKLAASGVVCRNYPDSVPFPGEERQRSKSGSKGINDLTLSECTTLIAALNASSDSEDNLRFEKNAAWIDDLRAARLPVIIGAPPEYDSPHAFAKRMFANRLSDRTGPPRQLTDKTAKAKTRVKKRKMLAASAHETISVADSDNGDIPVAKGKGKEVIVIADSDDSDRRRRNMGKAKPTDLGKGPKDILELPAPAAQKRHLPVRKGRFQKVSEVSVTVVNDAVDDVQDISSPSGSEFQPDSKEDGKAKEGASQTDDEDATSEEADVSDQLTMPISRKRKALVDESRRPAKKRLIVKVPHRESFTAKEKGKAPERVAMIAGSGSSTAPSVEAQSNATAGVGPGPDGTSSDQGAAPSVEVQPNSTATVRRGTEASSHDRPKPRLVTKKTLDGANSVDGVDPFSLRKRPVCAPSSSATDPRGPDDSDKHSSGGALEPSLSNASAQPPQETILAHEVTSQNVLSPAGASSTQAFPVVREPDAVVHATEVKGGEVVGGSGSSTQGDILNGSNPSVLAAAQDIGTNGAHEQLPYPAGWFGPPGPGLRFPGYSGPPFFGPYGGWGMFPNMDRQGHGTAAPQPGGDGGSGRSPFDLPGYFFGPQPFAFPNGYPPHMTPNMPGTSDDGRAAQGGASGGNTR